MITAFGASSDFVDQPDAYLPEAPVVGPVFPERDEIVQSMVISRSE